MSTRFRLERVRYMPKELQPGVLYISEEFGTAAHLCACGCGFKIRTPLGPIGWAVVETDGGPSLTPSIGNWQHPCQSHYWIYEGEIRWAEKWTPAQIAAGRQREEELRLAYYDTLYRERNFLKKFWRWLMSIFTA